jgi:subtilisin family serine protease
MSFGSLTGRGVRVAVIDSGINPAHPHVSGVAGGVEIANHGESADYIDRLGHGTAVAAVIAEKAPEAQLYAVKVFDRTLSTTADRILRAIDWSIEHQIDIANLSLGTCNPSHRQRFSEMISKAAAAGLTLVAARETSSTESLPGALPGVIAVEFDWNCSRQRFAVS